MLQVSPTSFDWLILVICFCFIILSDRVFSFNQRITMCNHFDALERRYFSVIRSGLDRFNRRFRSCLCVLAMVSVESAVSGSQSVVEKDSVKI